MSARHSWLPGSNGCCAILSVLPSRNHDDRLVTERRSESSTLPSVILDSHARMFSSTLIAMETLQPEAFHLLLMKPTEKGGFVAVTRFSFAGSAPGSPGVHASSPTVSSPSWHRWWSGSSSKQSWASVSAKRTKSTVSTQPNWAWKHTLSSQKANPSSHRGSHWPGRSRPGFFVLSPAMLQGYHNA